jgi:glycosyltransferase domain-containing protein
MKLTIILTLKGRDEFTYRWMKYMNEMRCLYKILLADGGDNLEIEAHLRHPNNYPNLDYEYIRYPLDASLDDYFNKLENVISRVKTDYILHADNDDFYLLDRIPEMITFLDDHRDYVAARGQLVNFEVFDIKGITKAQVRGRRYYASVVYAPSIESDCPLARINSLCQGMSDYDYYSNWYSITRTCVLQKMWKNLITLPTKEVIVLEMLSHVMMMNAGKLKIMSTPFYLRQSNTSQFGDTLIIGNEFLERCISNNSFSEFSLAVDRFMGLNNVEDRKEVLKSIAGWLNIFVFNIHRGHQVRSGVFYRFRALIKQVPVFGSFARFVFSFLKSLALQTPRRLSLRIKEIEPFIIVRN